MLFHTGSFSRWLVAAAGLAIVLMAPAPARAALPVDELVTHMETADPTLQSFRAKVEFAVGMYSFPYLHKTVHGEAYFKRPNKMQIVFSDLPAIAARFRQLYVGLGTPAEWRKKYEMASADIVVDGEPMQALLMTPKVPDRRLKAVEVAIDPQTWMPTRFLWRYSDGAIEMKQRIVEVDGHSMVGSQNADIRLPGVHAFVNAKITNHQVNAIFEDSVFTGKKPQ